MSADLDTLNDAQLSEVFAVECAGLKLWTCEETKQWAWTDGVGALDGHVNFATSVDSVLPYAEKFAGHIFERCFDYKKPHVARILPSLMYRETYRQEFRGQSTTLARAICIALILAKRAENGGAK